MAKQAKVNVGDLDVTDSASIAAAAATIKQLGGPVDVLVNNAGVGGRGNEAKVIAATNVVGCVHRHTRGLVWLLSFAMF
jgi:NAD(P)-dependent dehydrogenase (short-subunit alcohol dehydrogenase family)